MQHNKGFWPSKSALCLLLSIGGQGLTVNLLGQNDNFLVDTAELPSK